VLLPLGAPPPLNAPACWASVGAPAGIGQQEGAHNIRQCGGLQTIGSRHCLVGIKQRAASSERLQGAYDEQRVASGEWPVAGGAGHR
jgi:hypothetical protein